MQIGRIESACIRSNPIGRDNDAIDTTDLAQRLKRLRKLRGHVPINRRDFLGSIGASFGSFVGSDVNVSQAEFPEDGTRWGALSIHKEDHRQHVSGNEVSFRAIGEKLDSVRPATAMRGNGSPYSRESPLERDTNHLPPAVDTPAVVDNAYDFGMAHRRDKGLIEAHRYAMNDHIRHAGAEDRLSLRAVVDRHRNGYDYDILFCNFGYHDKYRKSDPKRLRALGRAIKREEYDLAFVSGLPEIKDDGVFDGDEANKLAARILADNAGNVSNRFITDSDHDEEFPVVLYLDNGSRVGPNPKTRKITKQLVDAMDLSDYQQGDPYANWLCPPQAGQMNKGKTGLSPFLGNNHNECGIFNRIKLGHGDISVWFMRLQAGTGEKYKHARQHQLSRILDTMGNKHPAAPRGEVTILAGTFDLPPEEYDDLFIEVPGYQPYTANVSDLNLQDAWLTHGGKEGGTDLESQRSMTDNPLCRGAAARNGYCDPYPSRYHNNRRKDFIFVEKPKATHDINLDIHRIRRRMFPVAGAGSDSITEHLALEMRVTVSPRVEPSTSAPPSSLRLAYSSPIATAKLPPSGYRRARVALVIGYDLKLRNPTNEVMNGLTVTSKLRTLDIATGNISGDYLKDPDLSGRSTSLEGAELVGTIGPKNSKTVHPTVTVPGTWVADPPSTAPQEPVPTEYINRVNDAAGSIRKAVIRDVVSSDYASGAKSAVIEIEHDTSPDGDVGLLRKQ